jgi:hypothetical protein
MSIQLSADIVIALLPGFKEAELTRLISACTEQLTSRLTGKKVTSKASSVSSKPRKLPDATHLEVQREWVKHVGTVMEESGWEHSFEMTKLAKKIEMSHSQENEEGEHVFAEGEMEGKKPGYRHAQAYAKFLKNTDHELWQQFESDFQPSEPLSDAERLEKKAEKDREKLEEKERKAEIRVLAQEMRKEEKRVSRSVSRASSRSVSRSVSEAPSRSQSVERPRKAEKEAVKPAPALKVNMATDKNWAPAKGDSGVFKLKGVKYIRNVSGEIYELVINAQTGKGGKGQLLGKYNEETEEIVKEEEEEEVELEEDADPSE